MGKKRKKDPQQPMTDAMASVLAETPEPASIENGVASRSDSSEPSEFLVSRGPELPVTIEADTPSTNLAMSDAQAAEIVAAAPVAVVALAAPPAPPAVVVEAAAEEPPPVSEAVPSTSRPKKRKKKRVTTPPVGPDALDQKIDRLEAKLEAKKEEAAKAAREGFGSNPALDDQSVPPVDLEVHDEFFAAGEKGPITRDASGAFSAIDARHAQKMTAAARARRAHLSRYVMWAVGAAAGILLLGVTVNKLRGHPAYEPVHHEVAHAAAALPEQQVQPGGRIDPPPVIELTDQGNVDDKQNAKVDEKDEAKVEEVDKKPEDMPAEKPKNAWQEKQAAKAALERSANGVAIAAGERSVALDPSDGEAWLVLGGAYQAMGNAGQAKRCYNACVSQGKKGPISDCRDMLGGM